MRRKGIKDKMWDFWACEGWRVPIREVKALGEALRELKQGGEGERLMLPHEGGRCYLDSQAAMSSNRLGVRSKTRLTSRWNKWKLKKGEKGSLRKQSDREKTTERNKRAKLQEMPECRGLDKEGPPRKIWKPQERGNAGLRGAGRVWKQQLRYLFLKKSLKWFEPRVKNDWNPSHTHKKATRFIFLFG